ncbi:MAG: DUF4243 domain-containing protein [Rhizobiales bacterium]|nr:DUF4243 domain-containing protein [Hyphomicrobiales bacterium]
MAYWADSYLVLDQTSNEFVANGSSDINKEIFDDIRNFCIEKDYKSPNAANIHARIKAISQSEFAVLFMTIGKISKNTGLDKIAVQCLKLYLNTRDFTILHCVTSCHALRIIFEFLDKEQQNEAVLYYWQSVIFAYISIETPKIKPIETIDLGVTSNVQKIKDVVKNNFNDHDIKIAFTAIEEFVFYKDDRFLKAAL